MGETTGIEWCDSTFNPWIGCSRVSTGCVNCYAERLMDTRFGRVKWGPQGTRVRTSETYWRQPLIWNREAERDGVRRKVFCASLADIFEEKSDQPEMDEWRDDLFYYIEETPRLDWLLLTKRPENVMQMVPRTWDPSRDPCWNALPHNVWIGASVENQKTADERIPELLSIPAAVRFLSCEPLLEEIDLTLDNAGGIDQVIVGGESGPIARLMDLAWARNIRDQCRDAAVPFFMKQIDKRRPIPEDLFIREFPAELEMMRR